MKLGEVITTIPTIGFNVETVQYKSLNMTVWDVGGQTKIRPLWQYYYQNTNAVIYVCDSTDNERFNEAKQELHSLLASVRFAPTAEETEKRARATPRKHGLGENQLNRPKKGPETRGRDA